MGCGSEPGPGHAVELFFAHPGMGRKGQLDDGLLAEAVQRLHVPLEQGLERLTVFQYRILGCELLHPIHQEKALHLDRLLAPERPVVVERRDPLGRRHEVAALLGHPRDEVEDRGFRRAVIPGREIVPCSHAIPPAPEWALLDSNQGPTDYESAALTT